MPDSFDVHPVAACAQRISDDLLDLAAVPVELMTTGDKAAALVAVTTAADQLAALRLRLLAAADDLAVDTGARDAAAWLAHETRRDRSEQQRDLRLGAELSQRWQRVGDGLGA